MVLLLALKSQPNMIFCSMGTCMIHTRFTPIELMILGQKSQLNMIM
jgi:hypothetical protein